LADFLPLLLRALARLRGGTLAPARRASDRPIAIACLRLLTLRPERPLRNVPALRSCMTFFTFEEALRLYFRAITALLTWNTTSCNACWRIPFRRARASRIMLREPLAEIGSTLEVL